MLNDMRNTLKEVKNLKKDGEVRAKRLYDAIDKLIPVFQGSMNKMEKLMESVDRLTKSIDKLIERDSK